MFYAYQTVATERYRERFGLAFEQFAAGQRFQHRPGLTLSQQDNKDEALDTLNQAMLHYDAVYAAATEWREPLLVSTLTLQVVIGMTSKTFGAKRRIASFEDIALTRPVFGGDTLYAESEILATVEDHGAGEVGRVSVVTRGVNQRGEEVCAATYTALVERAGVVTDAPGAGGEARLASHRTIAPAVYREQTGLDFEDLRPGETWEHRPGKTFLAEEGVRHALRALEQSARLTEGGAGRRVAINEVYLVGAVTALTTKTLGKVAANLGWTNVQLPHPVHDGDTVYAESTILDTRASRSRPGQGIAHVATRAFNQDGALVCSYERRLLVYRKGQGPEY